MIGYIIVVELESKSDFESRRSTNESFLSWVEFDT